MKIQETTVVKMWCTNLLSVWLLISSCDGKKNRTKSRRKTVVFWKKRSKIEFHTFPNPLVVKFIQSCPDLEDPVTWRNKVDVFRWVWVRLKWIIILMVVSVLVVLNLKEVQAVIKLNVLNVIDSGRTLVLSVTSDLILWNNLFLWKQNCCYFFQFIMIKISFWTYIIT